MRQRCSGPPETRYKCYPRLRCKLLVKSRLMHERPEQCWNLCHVRLFPLLLECGSFRFSLDLTLRELSRLPQ